MKHLIIASILLSSLTLFAQNIEIIGGVNKNSFFDYEQKPGHFNSAYNSDYGYAFRIGIENVKVDWMTLRFTLGYEKYGGTFEASDGGLGGRYTTKASIDKSIISLGVFPINFTIFDRIDFNFGFELAGLLNENISGSSSGWLMGESDWTYDLSEIHDRYNAKTNFGLRGRIAYDINLSDKLSISPQYSYYLGLSNEFDAFPKETRSMRHYFGIGLQRQLN